MGAGLADAAIPEAFLRHLIETGALPASELADFTAACRSPLRRALRVNTLKITPQTFAARAAARGWQLTQIPWCADGFWLQRAADDSEALGNFIAHLQGLVYIQEASSMLPVAALMDGIGAPARVLDMAAAPGSKTTQLAAEMGNRGLIVANELSGSRVKGLYSNLQRCGISNTCLTHFDGRSFGDYAGEAFDAILLDAPCSGEGTVRKDPDALRDWDPVRIAELADLQEQLMRSAFHALKPGGRLVYSTCTLNREENQAVCQRLLDAFPEHLAVDSLEALFEGADRALTDEGYLHLLPHQFDSEGFFVARFRKTGSVPAPEKTSRQGRFPFQPVPGKDARALLDYLRTRFGFDGEELRSRLWQRDQDFWLFPDGIDSLLGRLRFDRIGVKVATRHGRQWRLHHEFAMAFGDQFEKSRVDLDAGQATAFCQGRDLEAPAADPGKGEVLLWFRDAPLGLGKHLGSRVKNSLPRALVCDRPAVMET